MIGIVPQELTLEIFETVFNTVTYTRGLYGKTSNPQYIEKILKDLSLGINVQVFSINYLGE